MPRFAFLLALVLAASFARLDAQDPIPGEDTHVEGIVVDQDGAPSKATLLAAPHFYGIRGAQARMVEVDGRFSLSLPVNRWVITAHAGGAATPPVIVQDDWPKRRPLPLRLVLRPASVVRGTVTRPDGRPAAGADVEAITVTLESGTEFISEVTTGLASADADGKFTLTLLSGVHYLFARSQGLYSLCGKVELRDQGDAACDLHLVDGETLRGRITDSHGRPVAGGSVEAVPREHTTHGRMPLMRAEAKSDAEGRYAIEHLPEGTYALELTADGFVCQMRQNVPATTGTVDFVLAPCGSIAGRVLRKADGKPVPSPKLFLEQSDWQYRSRVVPTSREDGTFVLDSVPPGRQVVVAWADGYAPATSDEVTVVAEKATEGIVLALTPGGAIRGSVFAADGRKPIAGARVRYGFARENRNPGPSPPMERLFEPVETDADGHFEIPRLPPGQYTLEISADGFGPKETSAEVGEGKTDDVECELAKAARIVGRIVGPDGKPCAHALVRVSVTGVGTSRFAESDADGRYEIGGLAAAQYLVWYSDSEGKELSFEGTADARRVTLGEGESLEVDFPSAKGMHLSGVVRCRKRVLADADVLVIPADAAMRTTKTDKDGAYSFPDVPPGSCSARVNGVWVEFALPEGQPQARQDFDLPAGGIAGHVLAAESRKPVGFASYYLSTEEGWAKRLHYTGIAVEGTATEDGIITILGIRAGMYTLVVRSNPYAIAIRRDIVVEEGKTTEGVDFLLDPPGSIHLRAKNADGTTAEHVRLGLWEMPSGTRREGMALEVIEEKESGAHDLQRLAPGQYKVGVIREGDVPASFVVEVKAGAPTDAEVVLRKAGYLALWVADEAGKVVEGADVRLTDAKGAAVDPTGGVPDVVPKARRQEGWIVVSGLVPGRYTGEVTSGERKGRFEATVVEGEMAPVSVVVRKE